MAHSMQALVIIDMQRWMFRLPERLEQVPSLIASIEQLTTAFEVAQRSIYHVRTIHKADRSTWSRLMLKYDYPCLLDGTSDAEPIDGYPPPKGAKDIVKTANSAFVGTSFHEVLRNDRITHLVLAGVFIDGCVGLTAADAAQRGYEVTFIDDAIGHAEAHLRGPLFEWLMDEYEIRSLKAVEFANSLSTNATPGNGNR